MQFFLAVLCAFALAYTATVPVAPWSTLTPSATFSGATTDHTHSFGIQIKTVVRSPTPTAAKRDVVNQIGDGQIQKHTEETFATPPPKTTASVVNQIGDGQIQHQTASGVNQIGDGQIQHQTTTTGSVANQISDGQIQATGSAEYNKGTKGFPFACSAENALSMTLKDSLLTDSKGRVGAIVANRQFQFDGPPPQAGSIYAVGWSVTADGYLAIGDRDVFHQCKSGEFYNLYDENIAAQCEPVRLEVIDFVYC